MIIPIQQVKNYLKAALECSIYILPRDPGLTREELSQAGQKAGYQPGEIGDALLDITAPARPGDKKLLLHQDAITWLVIFAVPEEPDYRNIGAFDFVYAKLYDAIRRNGARDGCIRRDELLAQGADAGIPYNDIEVAVSLLLMAKILAEKDDVLRFTHSAPIVQAQLPSQQRSSTHQRPPIRNEARAKAYSIVKEIIEARMAGRAIDRPANLQKDTGKENQIMSAPKRTVFIGHGRSPLWHELKAFLLERLSLKVEEFNSSSIAGIATTERLEAMLEAADFAFLIMTAEDDGPDGTKRARENVVHEVGLFQGRLGFKKAIVLLEEGCGEFSNITGLGQIRFPKGNVKAAFEEIRLVLERERVVGGNRTVFI